MTDTLIDPGQIQGSLSIDGDSPSMLSLMAGDTTETSITMSTSDQILVSLSLGLQILDKTENGDVFVIEITGTILNNSGAVRNYTLTLAAGNNPILSVVLTSVPASATASSFFFQATVKIVSEREQETDAIAIAGAITGMAQATTNWETLSTFRLFVKSSAGTATQTMVSRTATISVKRSTP